MILFPSVCLQGSKKERVENHNEKPIITLFNAKKLNKNKKPFTLAHKYPQEGKLLKMSDMTTLKL